jgi:hypothetical protein
MIKVLHLNQNNFITNISVTQPDYTPPGEVVLVDDDMRGWIQRGSTYDPVNNACIPAITTMEPYYVWSNETYSWEIDQEEYEIVEEQRALSGGCGDQPCE